MSNFKYYFLSLADYVNLKRIIHDEGRTALFAYPIRLFTAFFALLLLPFILLYDSIYSLLWG